MAVYTPGTVRDIPPEPVDGTPQEWERWWWKNCCTTFGEEAKQLTYAHLMGLANEPRDGHWPVYDLGGRSVLDLGGGPVSILLKTVNSGRKVVVDPCPYPEWVRARYEAAEIEWILGPAEEAWDSAWLRGDTFDECWIYNVLQHVIDPERVIETARRCSRTLRIFEWVETETNVGHPHTLHQTDLNRWIGNEGTVGYINENGAVGLAYWGVFDLAI